jgi:phosphocarrier protein HPr
LVAPTGRRNLESKEISRIMPTVTRETIIRNRLGLHARPAMSFVELANGFKSEIKVEVADGKATADGKSVMQMIVLEGTEGTKLKLTASGEDAEAALNTLIELIDNRFGEDE